jgi:hypothetical protein
MLGKTGADSVNCIIPSSSAAAAAAAAAPRDDVSDDEVAIRIAAMTWAMSLNGHHHQQPVAPQKVRRQNQ